MNGESHAVEKLAEMDEGRRILQAWKRAQKKVGVDVHVDSEWANSAREEVGIMMTSGTVVKRLVEDTSDVSVIAQQKPECHVIITRAVEGLQMRVWTDCNATTAIAWRRFLGRTGKLELVAGADQVRESEGEANPGGSDIWPTP